MWKIVTSVDILVGGEPVLELSIQRHEEKGIIVKCVIMCQDSSIKSKLMLWRLQCLGQRRSLPMQGLAEACVALHTFHTKALAVL